MQTTPSRFAWFFLVPAALLPILWGAFLSLPAHGAGYSFETIVDNQGDPITSFVVHSAQPLNDNGEVAFYGSSVTDFQGYYKSDGSTITTIATYSQLFLNTGFSGGINDGGSVVFMGAGGAYQTALYAGSGGGLTTYLYENTLDPNPAWIPTGAASINDSDQVAFSGGWTSNPLAPNPVTKNGFYRVNGAGGSVTAMAETGDGVYSASGAIPPALNDAGQAAFMMRAVADNLYEVVRYDNPGLTTIASGFTGTQIISMNSSGDVAFVNQNSTAFQVYHNGGLQTVASTADGFNLIFQSDQFINDDSDVVFAGNVIEYEGNPVDWNGVFDGPDVLNDQVLLFGDSLFGRTITALDLLGFNNAGQILMYVELSGPSDTMLPYRALVLATPPPAGDFDNDGDADGRDFLAWQRGESPNPFSAGDLADWQAEYNGGLLVATGVAVPEPGSVTLLFITLVVSELSSNIRRRTTAGCRNGLST